jgi:hypothetical protein
MHTQIDGLMADLIEWVARKPRTYRDVMDVWKTHCPRLTVWEDTIDRGYLLRQFEPGIGATVVVTRAGQKFLRAQGRTVVAWAPAVADA